MQNFVALIPLGLIAGVALSGCSEPVAPTQQTEPTKKLKVLFASAVNNVPMMVAPRMAIGASRARRLSPSSG